MLPLCHRGPGDDYNPSLWAEVKNYIRKSFHAFLYTSCEVFSVKQKVGHDTIDKHGERLKLLVYQL